ncbi:glutamate--tRNA ligase [Montanilutibacter psychrotolerans]|uniref:Glutamate--tRNA ligase n=1 Tax=Montanilutibacter psychrotolerans TaxID=1327343 RepID=A0A3M8SM39_9GAMM|nr:glutamate--tRNA ligase [Lysobacter psychrotolerans]RNF81853.1 glutamate--tRNA ligase [Lysobacter psychrotolerans]
MTCRTRFAPSPTGYLHIGGARTALYCWLEARRRGGQFILRIEDTDQERNVKEAVDAILEAMDWLGMDYDEGPIYQTQRLDRYREVAEQLVAQGKAYYAYETREELDAVRAAAMEAKEKPRYHGAYRERDAGYRDDPNRVIRFKNPLDGVVAWEDKVKGRIEISNTELDDLVIFRPDGFPTYNFAVVVDDIDMAITDVVRGDDHVNNTPRQINLYRALGATVPHFAHLPMILNEDGEKLSKRTGAADVMQYRDAGYLPHALLNYLARLGWSHGDQEIFSIAELTSLFDLKDVNAKASRLDSAKLGWLNQQYLKSDEPADVATHLAWHLRAAGFDLANGPAPADVVVALRDRVQTLKDMAERAAVWYQPLTHYDDAAVAKHLNAGALAPLSDARMRLGQLASWTTEAVSAALHETAEALSIGVGKVAQPLRVAITGTQVSPDISHTVYLAGQAEAIRRIDAALAKLPVGA